ncbi:polysaccharide pyruvyl transferase family protein [Burkholderia cenocepacia]|uniref:polysaccharide pyruvyl transferase family protein n=1 Tax=Burkholderia cenocepacia TaxID=95486 RepID=UPI0015E81C16|nr:polysaccharide pyruvyl transferase family protein [Burkholderia cenocepacia]
MESNASTALSRDAVTWLYRILLGREPETDEAVAEALQVPSFDELRRRMLRSAEFQSLFSAAHEQPAPYGFQNTASLRADVVWHSRLAGPEVDLAYNAILKRDLTDARVRATHVSHQPNLFELVRELLESDEFNDRIRRAVLLESLAEQLRTERQVSNQRAPRVLSFGAFLNGNVGDFCQIRAIDSLLRHIFGDTKPANLFGCSWERKIDAAAGVPMLPRSALFDAALLRTMDLIVIGGGGLLSTPHFPLYEAGWVEALIASGTPYAIVGVGASTTELEDPVRSSGYRQLITNAFHVSGRDATSIAALRRIRSDAAWMFDPFVSNRSVSRQAAGHRSVAPIREVVLVPKFPVDDLEERSLRHLKALESALLAQGIATKAVLMEPALDRNMPIAFQHVVHTAHEREFLDAIQQSDHVYTMRYHGAIFSLSNGVPCSVYPVAKIKELFEEIGLTNRILSADNEVALPTHYTPEEWNRFANFLARARHFVENLRTEFISAAAQSAIHGATPALQA